MSLEVELKREENESMVNGGDGGSGLRIWSLGGDGAAAPLAKPKPATVTIDGKEVVAIPEDSNLVDLATRARVAISAPCYRTNREGGCCKSCVVEVDGVESYACATKPKDGMEVVVRRPDLVNLRRERVKRWKTEGGQPCDLESEGGGGGGCSCSC